MRKFWETIGKKLDIEGSLEISDLYFKLIKFSDLLFASAAAILLQAMRKILRKHRG